MECPRCNGKLKRLRTVDGARQVIRYNKCLNCGERIKTIELYVIDFESQLSEARMRAIRSEQKAEQLSLNLVTIQTAFKSIHGALTPVRTAEQKQDNTARPLRSNTTADRLALISPLQSNPWTHLY